MERQSILLLVIAIAMRDDLTNTDSTIISTVAYETNLTSMVDTKRASDTRDSIIFEILGAVSQARPGTSLVFLGQDSDDIADKRAYLRATEPSVSKVEAVRVFYRELQDYFRYAILSTISLFVVVSILHYLGVASFDYIDATIILFIALVVELGVAIQEERAKSKQEV